MRATESTRFDVRLPIEQKKIFEYVANLGGFRTLTEFIIYSVQKQASLIVEQHNAVLASKKDQKIFFNAIMNPQKPNSKLKKAMQHFNKIVANK